MRTSVDARRGGDLTRRIGLAVLIAAVVLTVLYALFACMRPTLVFAGATGAGAATIYAAYFAGAALRDNILRDRQTSAYRLFERYDEQQMAAARTFIDENVRGKGLDGEAVWRLLTKESRQDQVDRFLNLFEDIALMIQAGYADEPILWRAFKWSVPAYFDVMQPYIEHARAVLEHPDYCSEFERLVRTWRQGKYLENNRPLPNSASGRAGA